MHKYKISFLSNSISHEGRLNISIEGINDNIALNLFKDKYTVLEPYNVLIQRYIDDDELEGEV